jgi:hypothetical protein
MKKAISYAIRAIIAIACFGISASANAVTWSVNRTTSTAAVI